MADDPEEPLLELVRLLERALGILLGRDVQHEGHTTERLAVDQRRATQNPDADSVDANQLLLEGTGPSGCPELREHPRVRLGELGRRHRLPVEARLGQARVRRNPEHLQEAPVPSDDPSSPPLRDAEQPRLREASELLLGALELAPRLDPARHVHRAGEDALHSPPEVPERAVRRIDVALLLPAFLPAVAKPLL